jgi:hypothetical protein
VGNFSNTVGNGKEEWARADEMEAQRGARPNPEISREVPKCANAKLDQLLAAFETPIAPPQSPEPHSKDA